MEIRRGGGVLSYKLRMAGARLRCRQSLQNCCAFVALGLKGRGYKLKLKFGNVFRLALAVAVDATRVCSAGGRTCDAAARAA